MSVERNSETPNINETPIVTRAINIIKFITEKPEVNLSLSEPYLLNIGMAILPHAKDRKTPIDSEAFFGEIPVEIGRATSWWIEANMIDTPHVRKISVMRTDCWSGEGNKISLSIKGSDGSSLHFIVDNMSGYFYRVVHHNDEGVVNDVHYKLKKPFCSPPEKGEWIPRVRLRTYKASPGII